MMVGNKNKDEPSLDASLMDPESARVKEVTSATKDVLLGQQHVEEGLVMPPQGHPALAQPPLVMGMQ